jgi:thioredoxin 1
MGNAIELTDANFDEEVISSDIPVIVDFWAVWCGPCKMIAPVVDEIAEEYRGKIKVGKLDVDNNRQIATNFMIRSIPTLLIFKNGRVVEQIIGVVAKSNLVEKIEKYL